MNVRAAYIHVIGDAIQSVGVIAASIIIYFGGQEYTIADRSNLHICLCCAGHGYNNSYHERVDQSPDGGKS